MLMHSSCQQILSGPQPGPGDAHGCPFRHFSVDNLIATIEDDFHIRDARILREIKEAVTAKHYHIACTKVFEATHSANGSLAESINHPNHYFETSFGLAEIKTAEN
jgi:DNA primase large subunit